MNLNDKERAILAAAEMDAARSVALLAKETDLREHVVRYHLHGMAERGIIQKPQPFINMYRLGYVEYVISLSLAAPDEDQRTRFIEKIRSLDTIALAAEIGGNFQYGLLVCTRDIGELYRTLQELSQFGGRISRQSLGLRMAYTRFARTYLYEEKREDRSSLHYSIHDERVDPSDVNTELLSAIALPDKNTLNELSQVTGLPIATVERHKKTLEQRRIIEGYIHRVNTAKLGLQQFRLQIATGSIHQTTRDALFNFAAAHPEIVTFEEFLGDWSFVMSVETENALDVVSITNSLYEQFGNTITSINSFLIYRFFKTMHYQFSGSK